MPNIYDFLQTKRYFEEKNYKILNVGNGSVCYIFCSSNGIYGDVDENNYQEYIQKDYYEWQAIAKDKKILKSAGKIIFIRDVFVKSYVDGINHSVNSIDSLIELLCKETLGYELILAGVSSGGYLATILGCTLSNVKFVFSFGGIVSLFEWGGTHDEFCFDDISEYRNHLNDNVYSKWYSLEKMMMNYPTTLLLFYGCDSKADQCQINLIKSKKSCQIHLFAMDSNKHGGGLAGFNYPFLLSSSEKHLNNLILKFDNKERISQLSFSLKNIGFFGFAIESLKRVIRKIKRNQ